MEFEVYTDGGCRGNPGLGAWAILIIPEGRLDFLKGGLNRETTNNQMELQAVLEVFNNLKPKKGDVINIHSDSEYVINIFTKWIFGWIRSGELPNKKNADLITLINTHIYTLRERGIEINFIKVPGHSDCKGNNIVDLHLNKIMDSFTYESKDSN